MFDCSSSSFLWWFFVHEKENLCHKQLENYKSIVKLYFNMEKIKLQCNFQLWMSMHVIINQFFVVLWWWNAFLYWSCAPFWTYGWEHTNMLIRSLGQCQHGAYVGQVPFKLAKKMNPFCHGIYVNNCWSALRMNVKIVKQLGCKFWKHLLD
jgi:hypothetical protein